MVQDIRQNYRAKQLDEYSSNSVTDYLIVLLDGVRAEDAIKDYTLNTSMYVEYMH